MGRHSKAVKLVGGVRGGLALLDDDERRRAIEAGERDIDDGVGFFRGTARPGTALIVAYVDEFRDRFRAGIGRDRPRPGDERHAGTGNPRRAPRRDSRHRQTGEGRGRRARPRGTRVRGGGAEPATPVLGLQDTGTDRNRVLREPSGASRPTIRAEQKTGHITRSAANCHAATIRAEQRWPRQPRRRAARASTIRSHEPAPPSSGLRQQNLRGEGAVLEVATQVAVRSLDDLGDVDQPETVPLV